MSTTNTLLLLSFTCLQLGACSHYSAQPNIDKNPQQPTQQHESGSIKHLIKTEFDRFADIEIRENMHSLRVIMKKLYKRNPKELKKSGYSSPEKMINYVFDHTEEHHYNFEMLNNVQSTDAIFLAFQPEYQGDRVLAYIVGLQTMLLKAHGGISDFYLTNEINPQYIYNVARNFEIAAWKLANAKDMNGDVFLISNSLSETEKNISIEREFGKVIGRTDFFAIAVSEKSQRTITRVLQNIASALFLPI